MSQLHLTSSPHIRKDITTQSIMLDVTMALIPALAAGTLIFGIRALLVVAVCVATAVASEFLWNLINKRAQTIEDLSAVVTGLLLGLNLPANVPIWQCVIGSVFAIIVVKCIFGGIGCNFVNPAITARVFMLIAFSSTMGKAAFPTFVESVDAVSGATPLNLIGTDKIPSIKDLLLGFNGGAIGETCAVALLLGGIYLIARKVITWHIPVSFIATVFISSLIFYDFNFMNALSSVLSGGLLIGAIFMATDYVTSPTTAKGKLIFGIGAGVITVLIRFWGGYPEGVSFAILLMNILNPYIDSMTQRKLFGGKK